MKLAPAPAENQYSYRRVSPQGRSTRAYIPDLPVRGSIVLMFARSSLTLSSVALVAFAATVCLPSVVEAAGSAGVQGRVAAASTSARSTASQLAEIQRRLTALAAASEPEARTVDALAQSLIAVRGAEEDAASITRFATLVAKRSVIASGANSWSQAQGCA